MKKFEHKSDLIGSLVHKYNSDSHDLPYGSLSVGITVKYISIGFGGAVYTFYNDTKSVYPVFLELLAIPPEKNVVPLSPARFGKPLYQVQVPYGV